MNLSTAQQRMLDRLNARADRREQVPSGYRNAGRDASAWYRTAESLARAGLVHLAHG